MIRALTLLLCLQLAGEGLSVGLSLPIPGPVLGMAGLLAIFAVRGGPTQAQEATARGFLDNLGLLFVPAGVGVTLHLSAAAEAWRPILAAVVLGTLIAMGVTALVFRWLSRLSGSENGG
jgi:holin-like protein